MFPSEQPATARAQYEEVFNSQTPPDVPHQHGGSIDIVSDLGAGTTVAVWLPLHHPEVEERTGET